MNHTIMMTSDWLYKGNPVTEEDTNKKAGFIYMITDLTTNRKYIGKKVLTFKRKLKRSDKRRTSFESDWKDYYGSSKELHKLIEEKGKENFKREIICFGKTRGEISFYEVWAQFLVGVLHSDEWINDAIGKYQKSYIKKYGNFQEIQNFFEQRSP